MSTATPIKVLVIHDDPLTRAGLIAALQIYTDIEPLSAELGRIEATLGRPIPEPLFADVLVANYSNAIRLAEAFARQSPMRSRPKILIVTASDSEREIRIAIERGIAGYLLAGCPLEHLAIGVRALHRGARHFSPGVTQRLAESLATEPLTGREEAVLQLVVDGLCNKAIAARLGVALGTVKTHLKAIFDKLDVATRTQAVITVARRGLLQQRARGPEIEAPGARPRSLPNRVPDAPSAPTTRHSAMEDAHFSKAVSC
jgi:DNA-binding NarL/FixJ family response regulator